MPEMPTTEFNRRPRLAWDGLPAGLEIELREAQRDAHMAMADAAAAQAAITLLTGAVSGLLHDLISHGALPADSVDDIVRELAPLRRRNHD